MRRFTVLDIFNENVFLIFIAFKPVYVKINQGILPDYIWNQNIFKTKYLNKNISYTMKYNQELHKSSHCENRCLKM